MFEDSYSIVDEVIYAFTPPPFWKPSLNSSLEAKQKPRGNDPLDLLWALTDVITLICL